MATAEYITEIYYGATAVEEAIESFEFDSSGLETDPETLQDDSPDPEDYYPDGYPRPYTEGGVEYLKWHVRLTDRGKPAWSINSPADYAAVSRPHRVAPAVPYTTSMLTGRRVQKKAPEKVYRAPKRPAWLEKAEPIEVMPHPATLKEFNALFSPRTWRAQKRRDRISQEGPKTLAGPDPTKRGIATPDDHFALYDEGKWVRLADVVLPLPEAQYKAVKPEVRKTSHRTEKAPRGERKPLPEPEAAKLPKLNPDAPDTALVAERKRWEEYWDHWRELVGGWWNLLAEEDSREVAYALEETLKHGLASVKLHPAEEKLVRAGLHHLYAAQLKQAMEEMDGLDPTEETKAAFLCGDIPSREGWERAVGETLDFLDKGLAEIHLRVSGGRSMASIIHAVRATKTRESHRRAYELKAGTKLNILASHLAAATREAQEAEDDFLGRAERGAAAHARRGVSLEQVKFEDRQQRLDEVVGEGPATVGDLAADPGFVDPTRAYARKMEREARRELMTLINTVAIETLKKRQKEIWTTLYINLDNRPHGEIAAQMGISKSAFSKTRTRALENVKEALAEHGIDGRIDGWVEKWWLEGPRVPDPATDRPMPAFGPMGRVG